MATAKDFMSCLFIRFYLALFLTVLIFLLREGMGYSAVKNAIRLKGYETLLVSGKTTDSQLKRKIFTWKLMPWMYKPTK